jgi:hypothetical protein
VNSLNPFVLVGIGAALLLLVLWLIMRGRSPGKGAGSADPLAEAEVYLAYGQKKKAMELLRQARITHPDRADITLKLNELRAEL